MNDLKPNADQTQLAALVNLYGLRSVLDTLVSVCADKSHECEMQRDLVRAQEWRRAVLHVSRVAYIAAV